MRIALIRMTSDLLAQRLDLPNGSRVTNAQRTFTGDAIEFLVEHDSFPDIDTAIGMEPMVVTFESKWNR